MSGKIKVTVTFRDNLNGYDLDPTDLYEYVQDAVHSMCKSLRPPGADGPEDVGHPLFNLNEAIENVYVKVTKR